MESLRRLRAPQVAPVDRIADPLAGAALDGVDHRHGHEDRRMLRQRRDGAADRSGIDQRPRGVVDQHIVGAFGDQPLQAVQHRPLPRRATVDRRQQLRDAVGGRVIEIALRRMDRDQDARDARMRREGLQAMAQHRPAGERLVLLREVAAKALTAAGGDDKNERARRRHDRKRYEARLPRPGSLTIMRAMSTFPIAAIVAISALLPLTILACRGRLERNVLGWLLLAAALVGGSAPAIAELQQGWRAGLAASLHVTAVAMLVVFTAAVVLNAAAMRLAALVGPYTLLLILLGWLASAFEVEPAVPAAPGAWFAGHVLLSIAAYAALTLAALAACGVLLEERAFKARKDSWATRILPPLAETEALQNALLKLAAILLLLALATGAANEFLTIGQRLRLHPQNSVVFPGLRRRSDPSDPAPSHGPSGAQGGALAAQRLPAADPGLSGGQIRPRDPDRLG